tara:strand:- start:1944 stop:2159 length:216 start_codon:yes stop_codon:yes gene_type:complete
MSRSNGKKAGRKWLVDYRKTRVAEEIDPTHPLNSPAYGIRKAKIQGAIRKEQHKKKSGELEKEREWWRKGI